MRPDRTHGPGRIRPDGAPLPELEPLSFGFWTGGREGELLIVRCDDCGHWLHPPSVLCPRCRSRELRPQPTSGRATVVSYTVNHQAWTEQMTTPFVIAVVELVEQPGLQLLTNLGGDPTAITVGMAVEVVFEQVEDVWFPVFVPSDSSAPP